MSPLHFYIKDMPPRETQNVWTWVPEMNHLLRRPLMVIYQSRYEIQTNNSAYHLDPRWGDLIRMCK